MIWGYFKQISNKKHKNAENVTLNRPQNGHLSSSMRTKTRLSITLLNLRQESVQHLIFFFNTVIMSANDRESTIMLILGLQINLSK